MFKLIDLIRVYMNEAGAEQLPGGGDTAPPVTGSDQPEATAATQSLLGGDAPQDAAEPFLSALPEEGDAEGWGNLWNKLGRPESAEGYELPVPEGDDGEFAKTTSAWMHEAGLTKSQAQAIAGKWNEFQAMQAEQNAQQVQQQSAAHLASIRKEWGNNFDGNAAIVKQAEARFAPPEVQQMLRESGLGNHPAFVNMFLKIGQSLSEAKVINGEPAQSGPKSTAEIFYGPN